MKRMTRQRADTARLKSPDEIEQMRRAGRIVHLVLSRVRAMAGPGVTTAALNAVAEEISEARTALQAEAQALSREAAARILGRAL